MENKQYIFPYGYASVPEEKDVQKKIVLREGGASFWWAVDDTWHCMDKTVDASFLSDEACHEGWFTGTMMGLCCQDLTASRLAADFDYFTYCTRKLIIKGE